MQSVPSDILGRPLAVGQWVAMTWRHGSICGLRIRQITSIQTLPRLYNRNLTRTAVFYRMTNGREQELTNQCLILDNYDGPAIG